MRSKRIITANSGEDSLSIIDYGDRINVENIELKKFLPKNKKLRPIYLTLDKNKNILLLNSWDNSLFRLNIKGKSLLNSITTGRYPSSLSLFKGKIYVLNSDSSSISVIDEKEFVNIENVFLAGYLTDMELDRVKRKLYIVNWGKNSISIMDIDTGGIKNLHFLFKPFKIIIEGRYLFILSFSNNKYVNYCNLYKFDLKTFKIIGSVKIKGVFYDFSKLANKDRFVLIDAQTSYIFELNYKEESIVNKRYIGGLQSRVLSDKENIYVNDLINNQIIILDLYTYKIKNKIRVGKEPQGIFLL